eukprot:UN27415
MNFGRREMYLGKIFSPIEHDSEQGALKMVQQKSVNIFPRKRKLSVDSIEQKRRKKQKLSLQRVTADCITIVPNNPKLPLFRLYDGVEAVEQKKGAGKYLLYCNHCKTQFHSKTTFREKYQHHLVNHRCVNINSRLQYVVGVRHRRCVHTCHPQVGCIRFVQRTPKSTTKLGRPLLSIS